jgi:hypothetical protein
VKHWTTTELKALREMHSLGFSAARIGEALTRSSGSVSAKLLMLGLSRPKERELFPGESAVQMDISVSSQVYYRFQHMCREHGAHPGIFLDSLLNNFMDSIDYQPTEIENAEVEAAE